MGLAWTRTDVDTNKGHKHYQGEELHLEDGTGNTPVSACDEWTDGCVVQPRAPPK